MLFLCSYVCFNFLLILQELSSLKKIWLFWLCFNLHRYFILPILIHIFDLCNNVLASQQYSKLIHEVYLCKFFAQAVRILHNKKTQTKYKSIHHEFLNRYFPGISLTNNKELENQGLTQHEASISLFRGCM